MKKFYEAKTRTVREGKKVTELSLILAECHLEASTIAHKDAGEGEILNVGISKVEKIIYFSNEVEDFWYRATVSTENDGDKGRATFLINTNDSESAHGLLKDELEHNWMVTWDIVSLTKTNIVSVMDCEEKEVCDE